MINSHWQHKLISSEILKVHHKLTFTQKLLFLIHSSTPRKKSVHLKEKANSCQDYQEISEAVLVNCLNYHPVFLHSLFMQPE